MEAGRASGSTGQPQTKTLARNRSRVGATFAACLKDRPYFESCLCAGGPAGAREQAALVDLVLDSSGAQLPSQGPARGLPEYGALLRRIAWYTPVGSWGWDADLILTLLANIQTSNTETLQA